VPGDEGAVAAMLINGRRDAIAPNVYDALFISGIGHVLSISGYHMAVVAGLIFFIVRAFFALIPGLAVLLDRPTLTMRTMTIAAVRV
jgi:competence protein ComEC